MRGEAKKRSDWNYALLEEIICPAYSRTLLEIATIVASQPAHPELANEYYSVWPLIQESNKDTAWGFVSRKFYHQIPEYKAFLMDTKKELKFITLYPPTMVWTAQQKTTYPDLEVFFLQIGLAITTPPQPILNSLDKCHKLVNVVQPPYLRNLLSKNRVLLAGASPKVYFTLYQSKTLNFLCRLARNSSYFVYQTSPINPPPIIPLFYQS